MKHDLKITLLLIAFFLAAQYSGLFITQQYVTVERSVDEITGEVRHNVTNVSDLPMNVERVDISEDYSWLYIMIAILIGTIVILVLARFKQRKVWKLWYYISLVFIMTFALDPFLGTFFAVLASALLAIFKTYKHNFFVHNVTEIFLYGGLAAMLVPIMNLLSAFILLIVIAIYDAIAVWKSKHMVTLAEFQSDSNVFAGLFIPYSKKNKKTVIGFNSRKKSDAKDVSKRALSKSAGRKVKKEKDHSSGSDAGSVTRAILGGGDIAFPLIFAGTVMKTSGFSGAAIIPPFATLGLFMLLYKSKKGKFYPAMPFISAGCILGYIALVIVNALL